MKRSGQGVVEYGLIFAMVAVMSLGILYKFNFKGLKNYVFMRPADATDPSRIKIEAMTDIK